MKFPQPDFHSGAPGQEQRRSTITGPAAPGSAGCQPAVLGSLPSTLPALAKNERLRFTSADFRRVAGRLPATAGWQPALPIPML